MKKILLYSGGMDSWLIDKLWNPDLRLYVDMHTKYSESEIQKIKKQNSDVLIVDFPLGQWERDDAIIPLRNLYLLMVVCNITGDEDIELCYGATAGDRSKDQSLEFQHKAEELLNYLYQPQSWIPNGKNIKIITEFRQYTKAQMLQMYLDKGGTLEEAFNGSLSCYHPDENLKECWNCKPCFRKFVAFAYCGYEFDKDIIDKNMKYIKEHIAPELEDGIYRCPDEDNEIRTVIAKYDEEE
jgi:7-cyano-7-deazaguanine synthase in queuosine biosynthesis